MKKLVTLRNTLAISAHSTREPDHVPGCIVAAVLLLSVFLVAINIAFNVAFTGQNLPAALHSALLIVCPIILTGSLAIQLEEGKSTAAIINKVCDDEIARQISWAAKRPYATGESRNCKISQHSDKSRILFQPILSFQYTALVLVAMVIGCLIATSLTESLPLLKSRITHTSDPAFTTFICLFSLAVICCVAWLLKKPVRALEFNKDLGVFWIEKYRVFGWKVGESAQMPIAQIHALQIINFSKQDAFLSLKGSAIHPEDLTEQDCNSRPVREYEVNVIFRSGERVNIISHRNCRAIFQDTAALASFLDVPVWVGQPASNQIDA